MRIEILLNRQEAKGCFDFLFEKEKAAFASKLKCYSTEGVIRRRNQMETVVMELVFSRFAITRVIPYFFVLQCRVWTRTQEVLLRMRVSS